MTNKRYRKKIFSGSVIVLLFFIKLIILLKRFLAAFFVIFIYWPGHFVLRFFFYQVAVRIYSRYLPLRKKINELNKEKNKVNYVFSPKLVHLTVVAITVILIFINLTAKTKAGGLTERAHKTIIASLIKTEFSSFEEEELIIETFDQEAVISAAQQGYLDNLASMQAQPKAKIGAPEESANEVMPTIQGGAALVKPDIAATKIAKRPRKDTIYYTVQHGDSISTIAEEFSISVNTVLWENNLSAYSIIRPGDKLTILPVSGIIHKTAKGENLSSIAKKYGIEEEKILAANKMADASKLKIGQRLLIPDGKKIIYRSYKKERYTGISAIKDFVKAPGAKPVAGNKMNWPTVGHRITQYYSWRHHAIDIGNKTGTAIYASDAGTIESLGWGKGYGNQIVINHGGGKKTRYAHLSKFYVKNGQKVSKGETIGAMGSTGWSTGPHLHFEIIINGRKYNPLNYIK